MYTYTKRKCTVNSINSQTSRPSDTLRLTIGVFLMELAIINTILISGRQAIL